MNSINPTAIASDIESTDISSNYSEVSDMLREDFERQRKDWLTSPTPDYKKRCEDLKTLKSMINENREEIIDAIKGGKG